MKPKYTATDLFKLRKPLKLLSIIDHINDIYVDETFRRMKSNHHTKTDLTRLRRIFKDFFAENLPGLSEKRMIEIADELAEKKRQRSIMKVKLHICYVNGRLLPLKITDYDLFSTKSKNHFRIVNDVFSKHVYGKER